MIREQTEIAVIGGGLVGAAIAWGLARLGKRVTVLDEGDNAFRASRGNFALVWVQSKGLGMPEYAAWTKRSADAWAGLASALKDETAIDVAHQRPGGLTLSLSEDEHQRRIAQMKRLHNQHDMARYPFEVLDHSGTRKLLGDIGPEVAGAIYCPLDGHVNSLKLFRALHAALAIVRTGRSRRSHRAAAPSFCPGRGANLRPKNSCSPPASATRASAPWSASTRRCGRSAARSSSPKRQNHFCAIRWSRSARPTKAA
jgi:glycine/D-amino acid oxidase-like deaminating enzyme